MKRRHPAKASTPPADRRSSISDLWLLGFLACLVSFETFRVGFFADDFHFLDVVRRMPFVENLLGLHGIFPYYRPLSRELYFYPIVAAGPAGPLVAHFLSALVLFGASWALYDFARRLAGRRVGLAASALFLVNGLTKFLVAWASGFQDILSAFLVLAALALFARRRQALSLVLAGLAPFAKETGFLAAPLIAAYSLLCERDGTRGRRLWAHAGVWVAAAAVHALVRLSWRSGGSQALVETSLPRLAGAALDTLASFFPFHATPTPASIAFGLVGGLAVALLWAGKRRSEDEAPGRREIFVGTSVALGLAPFLLGFAAHRVNANAYYVFPALPWIALAVGLGLARLPSGWARGFLALWVAVGVGALGFREPDLSRLDGWIFHRWDWEEGVRLSATSRSLSQDLRGLLASRPESLVVVTFSIPEGLFYQTEDGPAIREAVADPTLRAYWPHDLPWDARFDRLWVLEFDLKKLHLVRADADPDLRLRNAAGNLVIGQPEFGYVWASYALARTTNRPDLEYLRSAALLMGLGPRSRAWRESWSSGNLALARMRGRQGAQSLLGTKDEGTITAFARVLADPASAAAHRAMADTLVRRRAFVSAGVELRQAIALGADDAGVHFNLGVILTVVEFPGKARAEFEKVIAIGQPQWMVDQARRSLAKIEEPEKP